MQNATTIIGALIFIAAGCTKANGEPNSSKIASEAKSEAPGAAALAPTAAAGQPPPAVGTASAKRKLFLDVHDLGKGKVTAQAVAEAHKKDVATEGKYGVDYKAYWVDENEGKIYCLAEAPSADAAKTVHEEAHGLIAKTIMEVTPDNTNWAPTPGKKLFLDVHHLGAGKVTAKDVASAHQKDIAAQGKHNVKYLNYWLDEASGTVMCLSESPSAEAAVAVHREANGLIPDSIEEVSEGR
jgi:hypothetical protein